MDDDIRESSETSSRDGSLLMQVEICCGRYNRFRFITDFDQFEGGSVRYNIVRSVSQDL